MRYHFEIAVRGISSERFMPHLFFRWFLLVALMVVRVPSLLAEDWPQWLGTKGDSVWSETGIVRELPKDGPRVLWQTPISSGYSGPAMANGSVYVTDRILGKGAMNPDDPFNNNVTTPSSERVHCLNAKTGSEKWKYEYDCPYKISYPAGPRATPAISGGKVYTLGAMGDLLCLDVTYGKVIWSKNFPRDYKATVPMWGFCSHPLIYKNLVICIVGGEGATVVAFDKDSGNEKWKALNAKEPGYSSPVLITSGGKDQVVVWHAKAINGLDPLTGKKLWSVGLEPAYGMAIMAPRQSGDRLFAAGIGGAGVVLKLEGEKVTPIWQEGMVAGKEWIPKSRGLYPVNMTPFIEKGVIYGVDQPGMLRAVDLETGKKLWFTFKPVIGKDEEEDFDNAKSGTAFIVKNGDRFFIFSETGELIIAKLTREGYSEISRAKLLEPTGTAHNRKVVWSNPAYADKCGYFRNDKEIICVSLAQK
jgi:outer membrane protein assembly factor BamB